MLIFSRLDKFLYPMKKLLLFIALISFSSNAQEDPQWMRYASISPDGTQIVFTYKGDLYKVPAAGGDATTINLSQGS